MADPACYPSATRLLTDDLDYSRLDPGEEDCVVVATQHKGDHQSMARCLHSRVAYIALVASRKRSKLVLDYLREQGFGETELKRVYAPAGLDLGARSPEEIALSVLSEIVMLQHKASGAAPGEGAIGGGLMRPESPRQPPKSSPVIRRL